MRPGPPSGADVERAQAQLVADLLGVTYSSRLIEWPPQHTTRLDRSVTDARVARQQNTASVMPSLDCRSRDPPSRSSWWCRPGRAPPRTAGRRRRGSARVDERHRRALRSFDANAAVLLLPLRCRSRIPAPRRARVIRSAAAWSAPHAQPRSSRGCRSRHPQLGDFTTERMSSRPARVDARVDGRQACIDLVGHSLHLVGRFVSCHSYRYPRRL